MSDYNYRITLTEFEKSATADANGIDNTMPVMPYRTSLSSVALVGDVQ